MSTALSREEVIKVAELARLKLSEAEIDRLTSQLAEILGYVDILGEVETDEVEPMAHAAEVTGVFRPDEERDTLSQEAALANAPASDGQYFLVPPILEGS